MYRIHFQIRHVLPFDLVWVMVALVVVSCGGVPSAVRQAAAEAKYADAVERAKGDPELLRDIAVFVLEHEAKLAPEHACRIISGLRRKTKAIDTLRRLASFDDPRVQGPALAALFEMDEADEAEVRPLLSSEDAEARAAALEVFLADDPDSLDLQPFCQDVSGKVRRVAVRWAAVRSFDTALSRILAATLQRDPDPLVRASAARAGQGLGEGANRLLIQAIARDASEGVRLAAVEGLAKLGNAASNVYLRSLLGQGETLVALAAASQLAMVGDPEGMDRLITCLRSGDGSIKKAAAIAASQVGVASKDALISAIEDPDMGVRLQVALSLERIGVFDDPSVVDRLRKVLTFLSGEDCIESAQALRLLSRLERSTAEKGLGRLLASEDPGLRVAAASSAAEAGFWSLAGIGLSDADSDVRISAATAVLMGRR